ncbi:helix-turn-helix domain-containing protein [Alkalihalobacterium bogoriense]|uniref:helix-turn-helix domain-containing protein n=1 Tax=Alkalihalobacterium bogoriense TaxID=246272 RepID=UPI000479B171|nr:helix-turn-helix transcriptional regulator [Alkalihalobacterium bogoriense]
MEKQVAIGRKIRRLRKQKGLTLGELAEGICSIGKMSNIENELSTVSDEDLNKICEKLSLPFGYFHDPNISEKVAELDYLQYRLLSLLQLNQKKDCKDELRTFFLKIEEYGVQSKLIEYDYLCGLYQIKEKNCGLAKEDFLKVVQEYELNEMNVQTKLKSCNALAFIYFTEKQMEQCVKILEKGIVLSESLKKSVITEREILSYNLAIVYLYIGINHRSLQSLHKIKSDYITEQEKTYLKLLARFMGTDENNSIQRELLQLQSVVANDTPQCIMKTWALMIYSVMKVNPTPQFREKITDSFKKDVAILSTMYDHAKEVLALFHFALYISIDSKQEAALHELLLQQSMNLLKYVKDENIIQARNLYLRSLVELRQHNNKTKALSLLYDALNMIQHTDEVLVAEIIYEITQLNGTSSIEATALAKYHQHLQPQFKFLHFYDLLLPPLKY